MKRTIAIACALAMMPSLIYGWQSAPQAATVQKPATVQGTHATKKKKSSLKKKVKNVTPAGPLPAQQMPPLPATLMNSAPVKPSVILESGFLTIDAPNSTLSDVLSGVHRATGASIEGASPTERVAVKLGPGIPEQVIAALLRGTPYDYVILGSLGKQGVITRILLTRSGQSVSQPVQESAGRAVTGPPQPEPEPPADDSVKERVPPDDVNVQPPPDEADQATVPAPQPDPNAPKTPEQLFKELQELQLQKQPK